MPKRITQYDKPLETQFVQTHMPLPFNELMKAKKFNADQEAVLYEAQGTFDATVASVNPAPLDIDPYNKYVDSKYNKEADTLFSDYNTGKITSAEAQGKMRHLAGKFAGDTNIQGYATRGVQKAQDITQKAAKWKDADIYSRQGYDDWYEDRIPFDPLSNPGQTPESLLHGKWDSIPDPIPEVDKYFKPFVAQVTGSSLYNEKTGMITTRENANTIGSRLLTGTGLTEDVLKWYPDKDGMTGNAKFDKQYTIDQLREMGFDVKFTRMAAAAAEQQAKDSGFAPDSIEYAEERDKAFQERIEQDLSGGVNRHIVSKSSSGKKLVSGGSKSPTAYATPGATTNRVIQNKRADKEVKNVNQILANQNKVSLEEKAATDLSEITKTIANSRWNPGIYDEITPRKTTKLSKTEFDTLKAALPIVEGVVYNPGAGALLNLIGVGKIGKDHTEITWEDFNKKSIEEQRNFMAQVQVAVDLGMGTTFSNYSNKKDDEYKEYVDKNYSLLREDLDEELKRPATDEEFYDRAYAQEKNKQAFASGFTQVSSSAARTEITANVQASILTGGKSLVPLDNNYQTDGDAITEASLKKDHKIKSAAGVELQYYDVNEERARVVVTGEDGIRYEVKQDALPKKTANNLSEISLGNHMFFAYDNTARNPKPLLNSKGDPIKRTTKDGTKQGYVIFTIEETDEGRILHKIFYKELSSRIGPKGNTIYTPKGHQATESYNQNVFNEVGYARFTYEANPQHKGYKIQ